MDSNNKLRLLKGIGKVYDEAKESKLESALFEKIDTDLVELSDYFQVSKIQAFFLAHVLALNYKGDAMELKDLAEYFDCNPMKVLEFNDDFEDMYSKGILKKQKSSYSRKGIRKNDQFIINEKVTEAILHNLPMPVFEKERLENIMDVLEMLYNLGQKRDDGEITTQDLFEEAESIIEANLNFPLISKVHRMNMNIIDTFIFHCLVWNTVTGAETTDVGDTVKGIFEKQMDRIDYMQSIMTNENELIKRNLIEIETPRFFNDTEMKLSDDALHMLQEEGLKLFANKEKNENVIEPSKINFKELFFNSEERNQLDMLKTLLDDSKLKEIQSRLQSKNLPKGITTLLYGPPGTGKTETVYQFAKETNREIVRVDISQSKSKWFGESEKIIKRIFTDYKTYAKKCALTPILLFNEADAIISKRKENTTSNVGQTENTIQNIILEELENFEGIFFATTNLASNLDTAFERRFLFKIELKKPDISVKAKIWKSKLQHLDAAAYEILASQFDFSGGQIDNIVRKSEMHEIINGIAVNVMDIIDFCNTEQLSKSNRIPVGFKNN